jgi:serine/threonine protein kinase
LALIPGTRLGVFTLLEEIGRGGMGEVYRARDTKLDRDVAIKVLPEAFAHDAERLARCLREAKTLAALNHPNIAAIYGLEEADGIKALVMELVEGDDLSQVIADVARRKGAPYTEACVGRTLSGSPHRNSPWKGSPDGVAFRRSAPDGVVKVLDFGLAKAISPADVARTLPGSRGEPDKARPTASEAPHDHARRPATSLRALRFGGPP